jgi:hypothetical protein
MLRENLSKMGKEDKGEEGLFPTCAMLAIYGIGKRARRIAEPQGRKEYTILR